MKILEHAPIVMTLDAGGTNFVFSALQNNTAVIDPVTILVKDFTDDLNKMLSVILQGFEEIARQLKVAPSAISFAFPGPADYPNGIIGDLQNLPAFRGGVALGKMLENHFHIPTFINNDGDLFVYGEAASGLLPYINHLLEQSGSVKRFHNLFGVTLGTGFGGGIYYNGQLFMGDNSAAGEINRMENPFYPNESLEESLCIRALRRSYSRASAIPFEQTPEPKIIAAIAEGKAEGNRQAALTAFDEFADALALALVNAASLVDGLVVIGGGLSKSAHLFLQRTVNQMRQPYNTFLGGTISRMEVEVFNLENPSELQEFIKGASQKVKVPFSDEYVDYDQQKRIGIGVERNETSQSISIGAYQLALQQLQ
ncbi:MAG: ROK family protein [Bacteroidales bacterium]|nr:ROK family protein [Bacteroidales bacterium]